MFLNLFRGVFDADWMAVVGLSDFLLCLVVALILGAGIALCYMVRSSYTQSFVVTLALLPAIVCVIIMLVNGNIGAGVAVAGSFSLVRFRSASGTAREICTLFLAMGAGLICGMGYLGFALVFTVLICSMFLLYNAVGFGMKKNAALSKTIRIIIPENLDYAGVFDDIFSEYLSRYELVDVKTTNMGSMFRLTYDVAIKDITKEKEMIDKLRCRNGNLEIHVSKTAAANTDL